jgi:hypothetical protein
LEDCGLGIYLAQFAGVLVAIVEKEFAHALLQNWRF